MATGTDELVMAAAAGDAERVGELLRAGVPVDGRSGRDTALNRAVQAGHAEAARVLLAAGADGLQRVGAYWEDVPLRYAAMREMTGLVRVLLEAGVPPDSRPHPSQATPLTVAAERGDREAVQALIDAGASIDGLTEAKSYPLEGAAWNGRAEITRLLLDRGAVPDTAALEAAEEHRHKLAPGSERHADYERTIVLLEAALAREAGAPPDRRSRLGRPEPLAIAAAHGNLEAVQALIDAGASTDGLLEPGGYSLAGAAWDGRPVVTLLLLERGAIPDAEALGRAEFQERRIRRIAPGSRWHADYEQTIALLKAALA
ncbi:MAG TPA: ankyrin repeat domain-containing protein [Trebonia sp.]|jgi:ankyrin repeat protein|nr:ankyrin repeat domain-containing protein [Trebonia sp.]